MNSAAPADTPVVSYEFHRSREAVDRGAVVISLIAAIAIGVTTAQSFDSVAIGLVVGSISFALLAPLFAAGSR